MNKIFFALLLLCSSPLFSQVKINGSDLSTMAKPGEIVSYTIEKDDGIGLSFDGNEVKTESLVLNDRTHIKKQWNFFIDNKSQLSSMGAGRSLRLSAGLSAKHDHAYLSAKEGIFLTAGKELTIQNSILESPSIFLNSNCVSIKSFIKDAAFLQFEIPSEVSSIEIIRFVFSENASLPFFVEGTINVEEKAVGRLVVLGVKRVDIKFRDAAFK